MFNKVLLAPLQLLNASDNDDTPIPGPIAGLDSKGNEVDLRQRIEWYSAKGTLAWLTLGSFASLALIIVGAYLALVGSDGAIQISGAGIEVSTNNLGFGFAVLGSILYLSVGRIAVSKSFPKDKT